MYVTEAMIRSDVEAAFRTFAAEEALEAERAAAEGREFKRRWNDRIIDSQEYKTWLKSRIADARRQGQLLTEQQYLDYRSGRRLQLGDRARYIGETRIEDTPYGPEERPHGQSGRITAYAEDDDGLAILSFTPDPPPAAAAAGSDLTADTTVLVRLIVREQEGSHLQLERIPEETTP
jgi:hypothetical protein